MITTLYLYLIDQLMMSLAQLPGKSYGEVLSVVCTFKRNYLLNLHSIRFDLWLKPSTHHLEIAVKLKVVALATPTSSKVEVAYVSSEEVYCSHKRSHSECLCHQCKE